jgi:hypothetical protein
MIGRRQEMKSKLSIWMFVLALSTIIISGCGTTSAELTKVPTTPSASSGQAAPTEAATAQTTEPPSPVEPTETSQPPQTGLEAVIQVPATLPDGDSVELAFTLINHSETGVYVLQWYTPLEGLGGEIFRVERDGQPIPYEGPLAMRGDPTPDGYVVVDAGASVSATVDLAAAYDFSEPGEYTIAFISPRISHVARTEDQMAASVDDLGPVQMPSNSVVVEIQSAAGE